MLTLNKNSVAFRNTQYHDSGSPDVETKLLNRFDGGDMATKADIITDLWQTCHAPSINGTLPADVSETVAFGMRLCEIMDSPAQWISVQDRINESAARVFYAAVRRQIHFEQMDEQMKARLCAMTLSFLERTNAAADLALMDFMMNIVQLLAIPEELKELIPPINLIPYLRLMETSLLDTNLHLLAANKDGFLFTSSLLYNPDDKKDPFNIVGNVNLKELSTLFKNNAQLKLQQLIPGQKLMIPILSTPYNEKTKRTVDGHFSAILATKSLQDYRFYIFDSYSSPDAGDTALPLIKSLIGEKAKHQCFYFRQPFQDNNDCGFHTYNFFKLCICAPPCAFYDDTSVIINEMFDNYVQPLDSRNYPFDEDSKFISYRLRTQFVLDCIKNGYTDGLQYTEDMINLLRQPPDHSRSVRLKRQNSRRSFTLWNNLRSSLGNMFSLKRSNSHTKIKNNSEGIQGGGWKATYNAEGGNAECHKETQ